MAVAVADDLAADRVGCIVVDASQAHGGTVGPARVTVDATQPDRAIRDYLVDVGGARKLPHGPKNLVPATPEYPPGMQLILRKRVDTAHGIIETRGADEVQLRLELPIVEDVRVCVDQAGQHGAAATVDASCIGVLVECIRGAGGNDTSIVADDEHRKRLHA